MEIQNQQITAAQVATNRRLAVMPAHLQAAEILPFESLVYGTMSAVCSAYDGGYWEFMELSNGVFYMVCTDQERYKISVAGNYFDGEMSADAAGIAVTLMAFNALAWRTRKDYVTDLFYNLREYALQHPESGLIFAAID